MSHRVLAVVLGSALVVGCGGHEPTGQRAATPTAAHRAPAIVGAPGRLVGIGGRRSLFVHCVGAGGPTVVLEAGFGTDTVSWEDVQPQLGRTTRTCAYDRAGIGNSVALPGVHDARDEIDDLKRLVDNAHIAAPYVLVGHSYGGLLARLFARAHPAQVAGIVLVDAMGRDQTRRTLAVWPRSQLPAVRRTQATPVRDGVDLAAGEALASRISSLGDVPLVVITAGSESWEGAPPRLARALDRTWTTMQDELAALSPDHVHVVALRSDHFVQGSNGQPLVVIRAVRAVVAAARAGTHLPPCARLFRGSDVRCRD
jgi:pimeloyl-ACP methyl ester carboxylesterase